MKKVYLIAVIVAIIAGVATYMFATEINSKTKFKDAEMVTVLVPTADIEKNVEITADMFEGDNPQIVTKEILAADATDNYVKAQTDLVDDAKDVHMITVDKLYANEPINKNRLEDKTAMTSLFLSNCQRAWLLIRLTPEALRVLTVISARAIRLMCLSAKQMTRAKLKQKLLIRA